MPVDKYQSLFLHQMEAIVYMLRISFLEVKLLLSYYLYYKYRYTFLLSAD